MQNSIAPWGVELSLFRTVVGKEFEIIKRLYRTQQTSDATFFGAYGYFDLAAIRCLNDLSTQSLLPFDCDIVEVAPFRFFADGANRPKPKFLKSLKSWKTAIAIFFKIAPTALLRAPNQVRWQAAKILRENFQGSYVFFGLGFSEILVLVGGDDLPSLLNSVTTFRNTLGEKAAEDGIFFVKTATFPFISYEKIHRKQKYHLLKGNIHPVITISCDPASEKQIIKMLPLGMEARNSYGETDLVAYWKTDEVSLAKFAKQLTKFRSFAEVSGSFQKTTSYLETTSHTQTNGSVTDKIIPRPTAKLGPMAAETFRLIDRLERPSLQASVTDLYLRLFSCLSSPHLESGYQDMANTLPYIASILGEITASTTPEIRKRDGLFELSLLCDLARIAINQRYAGLETHPETLAHSQSPILSDIRSFVSAVSCLPYFIFSNLFPKVSPKRVWPGYVIFGTTYSPQCYPQDILAMPAVAIYDPISEWWKITHETAHAVFRLLKLEKRMPRKLYNYVERAFDETPVSTTHALHEIFANWFDWQYVFSRDTSFFLEVVWKSWLPLPIVLKKKCQYLTRTFIIFLAQNLESYQKVSDVGNNQLIQKYIPNQWQKFIECVSKNVDEFESYIARVTEEELKDIFANTIRLVPVLFFYDSKFETACRIQGLHGRLNPPYPKLKEHLRALENGQVISDIIPNPCRLQVELLRRANRLPVSLATQGAFIFSLENSYLLKTG